MADSTSYSHAHRAFLQSFLTRTTHTSATLKPVLARILSIYEKREIAENDVTEPDLVSYVAVVNAAISQYDLEIRQQLTQHDHRTNYTDDDEEEGGDGTRVKVLTLVNTTSDPVSQLATLKTPEEIAYLLRVLDCMFETQNSPTGRGGKEIMAVGHMQALQLHKSNNRDSQRRSSGAVNGNSTGDGEAVATVASGKKMSMVEAEAFLKLLVAEGWLEVTSAPAERASRYYILSPRALMELKSWLVETYNEPPSESAPPSDDSDSDTSPESARARARGVERIKKCAACQEIIISGQRCGELKCGGRLHDACTGAFWRSRRGRKQCPECEREWSGVDFVGVRAVRGTGNGRASTGGAARVNSRVESSQRTNRRRAETEQMADDDNDSSE
ncbi:MAG: hypothetical protein Q9162_003530 [Coniocarpon cinnabarinum]